MRNLSAGQRRKARSLVALALAAFSIGCAGQGTPEPPPADSFMAFDARVEGDTVLQVGASVDTSFFAGTRPLMGRVFVAADLSGDAPVVVISHAYWEARFTTGPDVIGASVVVNDTARVIVGVMPEGFDWPPDAALWIPRR